MDAIEYTLLQSGQELFQNESLATYREVEQRLPISSQGGTTQTAITTLAESALRSYQTGWIEVYERIYGTLVVKAEPVVWGEQVFEINQTKTSEDKKPKSSKSLSQGDASREMTLKLKKRKMNANRFRARPNKPIDGI